MYELGKEYSWKLVVTYEEARAREIYDDYRNFTRKVWFYPAKDLLFYAADLHGNMMTRQRIQVLKALMEEKEGVVITTFDGLMDHLLPLERIASHLILIKKGQELDLEQLKSGLITLGYERVIQVETMGQFSVRGGIVDIFPLTEEFPVRIELLDNEIDSIRSFELESQRSVEQIEEVSLYPAQEVVLEKEEIDKGLEKLKKEADASREVFRKNGKLEEGTRVHALVQEVIEGLDEGWKLGNIDGYVNYFCPETVSFIQYFTQKKSLFYLDEPSRLQEKGKAVETEFRESMSQRLEKGYLLGGQTELLYSAAQVLSQLQTDSTVYLTSLDQRLPEMLVRGKFAFTVKNVSTYQNSFDLLIKDLTRWKREGYRVVLLSASKTRASRLASDLRDYELRAYCPDERENGLEEAEFSVKPGEILVIYGNLHRGFEYPMLKFVVITETDMFGTEKKRRRKKKSSYEGKKILSFSELSIGDYVVHEDHGLGIYRGIEKIERDRVTKDYIKVEYGDGGNLYIAATRLDRIQKYAGAEAKTPKLNKLGGNEWKKTKTKVKGAVRKLPKTW